MSKVQKLQQLKDTAANQWPEILTRLGIDAVLLDGKHRPCPSCGGSDRFRFDDKGNGSHICNQCGAGDGLSLIMKATGCTFPEALESVSDILGLSSGEVVSYKTPPKASPIPIKAVNHTDALRKMWAKSRPLSGTAALYLQNRGLKPINTPVLRFHAAMTYYGSTGNFQGEYACMLALVQDVNGQAVGVHRTYLSRGGYKAAVPCPKKLRVSQAGASTGAAIRLCEAGAHLLLAEGIETALAVHDASGLPVWACISTHGLKSVQLPSLVKKVTICADKDRSKAGEEAAKALAKRLIKEGLKVSTVFPPLPIPRGQKSIDFADMVEVVS